MICLITVVLVVPLLSLYSFRARYRARHTESIFANWHDSFRINEALWMSNGMRAAFEKRIKSGGTPLMIHIGPNILNYPTEKAYYTLAATYNASFILVDPNPVACRELATILASLGANSSRTHIINAAVCPDSREGLTLFVPSARLLEVRPNLKDETMSLLQSTASFDKGYTIGMNKFLFTVPDPDGNGLAAEYDDMRENFPDYEHFPWSYFIDEFNVGCKTVGSLFDTLHVKPSDVDILIVDAEGFDTIIVPTFFALDDFAPGVLMHERPAIESVQKILINRSYFVRSHHTDVIYTAGYPDYLT